MVKDRIQAIIVEQNRAEIHGKMNMMITDFHMCFVFKSEKPSQIVTMVMESQTAASFSRISEIIQKSDLTVSL